MKPKSFTPIILLVFFVYFLMNIFSISCMGEPVVEELYHYPTKPLPLSTITYNAGIYNNSTEIEEVRLIAQECMKDYCFNNQTIPMNYSYSCCMDFYNAEFDLTYENTTQVKYHLEIKSNGSWCQYEQNVISLSIPDIIETDNTMQNNTIGFDIPVITLSILSTILFIKINQKIK
ncbi:MAG: hypothetical protein KGY65_07655 [Candidatus Thermoplasmatota archaeon]|nr:hypothetical protein [Candidatus Thermoplasmatota archaeon]